MGGAVHDHQLPNTSSVSLDQLLTELGFDQQARLELLREARQEAKAAKQHVTPPVIWALLVICVVPIVVGMSYGALRFVSPALRTLGMIVAAAGVIALMIKGRARERENVLRPHLKKILAKRGYRFCPNCEYNVSSLPAKRRKCPECGSRLELPEDVVKIRERKWFKANLKRHFRKRPFVKGIELTDAHFEALTDHILHPPRVGKLIELLQISGCLTLLAIAIGAAIGAFIVLKTKMWKFPAVVISILIGLGLLVLFAMINDRFGQRAAIRGNRRMLRDSGLNLCIHCGQYWGNFEPPFQCPSCGRRNRRS